MMTPPTANLRMERRLMRDGSTLICGVDEVGRGALGGPVSVGVVVVDDRVRRPLSGLRDSKLLTPAARVALVPRIRRWSVTYAVGHASAAEIDERGIIAALRLAGHRALAAISVRPDLVILDGNHNWLAAPRQLGLFDDETGLLTDLPPIVTRIKADMTCASVAAASVLAKTERDAMMVEMSRDFPLYGWDENKGYAAPSHMSALREHGPCVEHRRSWNLPPEFDDDEDEPEPGATAVHSFDDEDALVPQA